MTSPVPTNTANSVASAYDRWAATYDTDENRTRDLDAVVVRKSVPNLAGRDVLELGPGTGKNTRWIAARARSVIGLDASGGMLALARERLRADGVSDVATLIEHDIQTSWPVASESVDVVIVDLVLEHVELVSHVFAEASRVLRPRGHMFMCELHPIRQLLGGRAHFTDPSRDGEIVDVPVVRHTIPEFINAGIAAGLSVERLDEWSDDDPPNDPPRLLSVLFKKL
jgi:malonyl-CoA O-methyltransferase